MASMTVTQTPTDYTVEITNDSGDNGAWAALYTASTPIGNYNSYISDTYWQFLSGNHVMPGAPVTAPTLHFPLTAEAGPLEFRFWANGVLQASAPVVPPVLATSGTPDGFINVKDHGATGSPSGDDTVAIKAAADACRASYNGWNTKGLWFPAGGVYRCSSPVDFQGVSNIDCHGWLVYTGAVNAPCFRVGIAHAAYPGNFYFFGLYCTSTPYNEMKHPLIEFAGLQSSTVRIGANNSYVSVVGSASGGYNGTWKSDFHLGGTQRLELLSDTGDGFSPSTGWINSNRFHGGHVAQFRIGSWWRDATVSGLNVTTSGSHGFKTGDMVEMYNGRIEDSSCQIITVVDGTHFTLTTPLSANAGNGWRCMGPAGYHHNDNHFWCIDIEDDPAIVVINNGSYNHLKGCRTEATGKIVFGPDSYGNTYEASNSTHGRLPDPNEFELTVVDHSGGKNFVGWFAKPKSWGSL